MAKPHLFSFQWHSADSVPGKHPKTLTHAQDTAHMNSLLYVWSTDKQEILNKQCRILIYIQADAHKHTFTQLVHTSAVYHVQAWRTASLELSLTWMQIHAWTICQPTALHVGCMCNLDPHRPMWHHITSSMSHRVWQTAYLRLCSPTRDRVLGICPWLLEPRPTTAGMEGG